jgi:hypothetical protein
MEQLIDFLAVIGGVLVLYLVLYVLWQLLLKGLKSSGMCEDSDHWMYERAHDEIFGAKWENKEFDYKTAHCYRGADKTIMERLWELEKRAGIKVLDPIGQEKKS